MNRSHISDRETAGKLGKDARHTVSIRLGEYWLSAWGTTEFSSLGEQGIAVVGAVFNVAGLKNQLGIGDLNAATVLLHAYRRWGAEFPRYVEGEFAFALWDGSAGRLLLCRDPSGAQPLFYARLGSDLLFATRMRALLVLPGVRARLDEAHIARWLALIPAASNSTFFEGIVTLPPGYVLSFQAGHVMLDAYWHPLEMPLLRLRDSREYAAGLRSVLETAIRDRLPADSAVATSLSGGLDSSSVTALSAGLLQREGRRLFAFTAVPAHAVTSPGRFTDEGPYAAAVAAMHPNIDHVFVRHGTHSIFTLIDRFLAAQQEPIMNPANYDWIYEISLQAGKRGIGTVLNGTMGNLTISYDGKEALSELARQGRFLAAAHLAFDLRRTTNLRWRGLLHDLIRPSLPIPVRLLISRLTGRGRMTCRYSLMRPEFATAHGISPMELDVYFKGQDSRTIRFSALFRGDHGATKDAFSRLTGVRRTDPTRDRRVIEYCLSVPVEYYCEKGIPRSLIRNAMAGLLPEQVRIEQRRGLQAADFAFHFQAELQEAFAELARMRKVDLAVRALDLDATESLLRRLAAQDMDQNCFTDRHKLLRALSLGRFLRRFEDGTLFSLSGVQD